jgi:hypothetical protein
MWQPAGFEQDHQIRATGKRLPNSRLILEQRQRIRE